MLEVTTRVTIFGALVLAAGLAVLSGAGHVTAAPASQVADGAAIFANECSRCHGDSLEGGEGAPLVGPASTLGSYKNALNVLNYAIENMPNDQPATLAPEQYAQVIGFILSQNGVAIPESGLTPENAASIIIP